MMRIKLSLLITSILIQSFIIYSQQDHQTWHAKQSAAQDITPKELSPFEKYVTLQKPSNPAAIKENIRNQILCDKAFDYLWNIPNEHPKKKQILLHQACMQAKEHNHKVDLDLADKFFTALEPIYLDNCFSEQAPDQENLSLPCRKKRHAQKIATCYQFFQYQSGRLTYSPENLVPQKQGFTIRDMAEDRFEKK